MLRLLTKEDILKAGPSQNESNIAPTLCEEWGYKGPSPPAIASGETRAEDGYFFLAAFAAGTLAATACFFAVAAVVILTCFWVVFFWFDFGDLSPMILFGYMFYTVWWHTYLPASIGRLIDSLA